MTRSHAATAALLAVALVAPVADAANSGFQLERYMPAPAGEWSFAVESPWYAAEHRWAAAFSLDWAEDPLVAVNRDVTGGFREDQEIVSDAVAVHLDGALAFYDRLQISASVPFLVFEIGNAQDGVAPSSGALGDVRIGFAVRVVGRPESGVALSVAAHGWVPLANVLGSVATNHAGDTSFRFLPRLVLSGITAWVRYALDVGYLVRATALLGSAPESLANTVGDELQLSGMVALTDPGRHFSVGPELLFSTGTFKAGGESALFSTGGMDLEVLIGAHMRVGDGFLVGAAGGFDVLHAPGSPEFRMLARFGYASPPPPARRRVLDSDGDGIPDELDACPRVRGVASTDPKWNGCPPPPPPDRDRDGIPDTADACPDEPAGAQPDPTRPGCPAKDRDGDGVYDHEDLCPDVPAGEHPDPKRKGCPDRDSDGDGVYDGHDECPQVPAGVHPDPEHPGCPLPDRDGDGVPDRVDACPDQAGAPSTAPGKNGCPGLVEVKGGQIELLSPIVFATDKDRILPKSFPVLDAVADALRATPEIERVAVEAHVDAAGGKARVPDLAQRRASAVMQYLVRHGIAADRLEAHGDESRPAQGVAPGGRVELRLVVTATKPPSAK